MAFDMKRARRLAEHGESLVILSEDGDDVGEWYRLALDHIDELEKFRSTVLLLSMEAGRRERELTARVAELEGVDAAVRDHLTAHGPCDSADDDGGENGRCADHACTYCELGAALSGGGLTTAQRENAKLTARVAELESSVAGRRIDRRNAELRAQLATAGKQLAKLAKLGRQREERAK